MLEEDKVKLRPRIQSSWPGRLVAGSNCKDDEGEVYKCTREDVPPTARRYPSGSWCSASVKG
jgi:hypothetical protein